jgi:hypothetical protein
LFEGARVALSPFEQQSGDLRVVISDAAIVGPSVLISNAGNRSEVSTLYIKTLAGLSVTAACAR